MHAFTGLIVALLLAGNGPAGDDPAGEARRTKVSERQLFDLIRNTITIDPRHTNLYETDDLSYEDMGPLKGDTLVGVGDRRLMIRRDVATGGKTGARTLTYRYRLLYLPETASMGMQVMRITGTIMDRSTRRISFQGMDAGGAGAGPDTTEETVQVVELNLDDLLAMETVDGEQALHNGWSRTAALRELVEDLERRGKVRPLRPATNGPIPRRPDYLSAESNRDYIRYARVNGNHPFADLDRDDRPLTLEATFSTLALSHKRLYAGSESIGIHGFGFEMGFGDRVLNLVSFQSPSLYWGLRFLVFFNDARGSLVDSSFFLDLKILGRSPVNTAGLIDRWRLASASPVMSLDRPLLNTTPGATIEVSTGSAYHRVPFLNFRYSGGGKDYERPFVTEDRNSVREAYFTMRQWEASLAYFWNIDRTMFNRFRFDVGAGTYDVRRVSYDAGGDVSGDLKLRGMSQVQPLLELQYTHVSNRARFGAGIRMFDNRLTFTPWFKVFETGPHEIRLEAVLMPRPVGRSLREWETDHAHLVQVRYRFGFDKNF